MTTRNYVFEAEGDRWRPTRLALSPWSEDLLHGGPTAALVARAVQQLKPDPEFLIARLTIDMFRPVPARPLETKAELVRSGRRIAAAQASVLDGEVEVARATALMLRTNPTQMPAEMLRGKRDLPSPESVPVRAIFSDGRRDSEVPPGFHLHIEVRPFRDEIARGGGRAVGAWLRFPHGLFEGEEMGRYIHVAALSDFANGLGNVSAGEGSVYINCDITLTVHREPVGEYVAMELEAGAGPAGIGSNYAILSDVEGVFGGVTQSLLLNPRAPRAADLTG